MHLKTSAIFIISILLFDINSLLAKNIENECRHCRILTDSFDHWYKKTSRGKFEGGDAAWEEAKLRSYARSEIRLVEIQEGLCSEVKKKQDDCYRLSEEAEQAIEKWWYSKDVNAADFYTWLCIDALQYCCPQHHYGDLCTPCPLGINNEVCSGNGQCNGDGTRTGSGKCDCRKGHTGKFCEKCSENFYSSDLGCERCHKSCEACTGGTENDCRACKVGWSRNGDKCIDIDECLTPNICKANEFCVNTEGSHVCEACHESCATCQGHDVSNCTSCFPGKDLWSGMCVDEITKDSLVANAYKKIVLYLVLLVISIFIYRRGYFIGRD